VDRSKEGEEGGNGRRGIRGTNGRKQGRAFGWHLGGVNLAKEDIGIKH